MDYSTPGSSVFLLKCLLTLSPLLLPSTHPRFSVRSLCISHWTMKSFAEAGSFCLDALVSFVTMFSVPYHLSHLTSNVRNKYSASICWIDSAELDFLPILGVTDKRNEANNLKFLRAVIIPHGHLMQSKWLSNSVSPSHPHKDSKLAWRLEPENPSYRKV